MEPILLFSRTFFQTASHCRLPIDVSDWLLIGNRQSPIQWAHPPPRGGTDLMGPINEPSSGLFEVGETFGLVFRAFWQALYEMIKAEPNTPAVMIKGDWEQQRHRKQGCDHELVMGGDNR